MISALEDVQRIIAASKEELIDRNSSVWWQERQSRLLDYIRQATSAGELIRTFQKASFSGFDHRVDATICDDIAAICRYKWLRLGQMYPDFRVFSYAIEEATCSDPRSVLEIDGRRVSNIFLSHLGFFLFIRRFFLPASVLEIGGGYGSLARIFCTLIRPITYVIVDVPSSLFCAYVFLRHALPDVPVELDGVSSAPADAQSSPKIILVAAANATEASLGKFAFDLAINSGSFQEMPGATCDRYQNLVFRDLQIPAVYSNNYFCNANAVGANQERELGETPLIPRFPPEYRALAAVLNNPIFDIDACERNWLEVLLYRNSARIRLKATDFRSSIVSRAINAICGTRQLGLLRYLFAYAFIAYFYCGGSVELPFGPRIKTRSNLIGMPNALAQNAHDPVDMQRWLSSQLVEVAAISERLNPNWSVLGPIKKTVERRLLAKFIEWYRPLDHVRYARKGLPSITQERLTEFERGAPI